MESMDQNKNLLLSQHEHSEIFSDTTLSYIRQILLEDDTDEKFMGYQDESALLAMEKPFYDILTQKCPSSPNKQSLSNQSHAYSNSPNCLPWIESMPVNSEFLRGIEEGMKFLPSIDKLSISSEVNKCFSDKKYKIKSNIIGSLQEKKENKERGLTYRSRGQKNPNDGDLDLPEGRNLKMPMHCLEDSSRNEMFDKALLYHGDDYAIEEISSLQKLMQCKTNSDNCKKEIREECIDLTDLLVSCSQLIAYNEPQRASELIKQIRKHSCPDGDGTQRLACIFADGLEARLAGTGSQFYHQLATNISATKILKAYHLYIRASPFMRVNFYLANHIILNVAEESKLHIIDLGINFGFQWPSLIQFLSQKKGKIPKLRITGVDLPQSGFRPSELLKATGRRLEDYARSFNVPFEYQCIASQLENICVEDFKIQDDEVVIFNSFCRFRNLGDETTATHSTRQRVLNLIQQIKPKVFIHGIINSSHSGSAFVTRFKQVLFHYSAIFDMLDTTIPRDNEERKLIERELCARDAINVIACEGAKRVERPEPYKQWHRRNLRAGFEPVPMDQVVLKKINNMVAEIYDKRYFVNEESLWLLQGWKGKILYALSAWKPKEA